MATVETALIKDAYEGDDLKIAMTCLQSLIIIGPAAAPFLGTFLLSRGSWRLVFWFLAACGAVSLVFVRAHFRDAPCAEKTPRAWARRCAAWERA